MARRNPVASTVPLGGFSPTALKPSLAAQVAISTATEKWYRMETSAKKNEPAHVYITDVINDWFGVDAHQFVRDLMEIDNSQIMLHLNSPGGSVFDGVMIYNALRSHKANVTVQVEGLAASAASFIAQAGDEIVMMLGSMMMIHDASAIAMGNAQDMRDTADVLDKISDNIAQIYSISAGEDTSFWRELMKEETWYSAQEAVDAGLADRLGEDEADSEATNRFDLVKAFNYAGRTCSPSPQQVRQLVYNRVQEAHVSGKTPTSAKNTHPNGEEAGTQPAGTDPNQAQPQEGDEQQQQGENGSPDPQPQPPVPAPNDPNAAPAGADGDGQPVPEGGGNGAAASENSAKVTFVINGQRTTDPTRVQQHINSLETAQREQKMQNRKDFVAKLATDNKILANQITALEELVCGTDSEPGLTDSQYEKWCASWNAAPSLPQLASHGNGNGSESSETSGAQAQLEQELQDAADIVRQNKRANMPHEKLEQTNSYKKLVAHNALHLLAKES